MVSLLVLSFIISFINHNNELGRAQPLGPEISLTKSIYVSAPTEALVAPNKGNSSEATAKQPRGESVDFDDWPQDAEGGHQEVGPTGELMVAHSVQRAEAAPNNSGSMMVINLPGSPSASVQNLNGGFLVLFDEITRMKNNSINALIRLQYFDDSSLISKQTGPNDQQQQQQNNMTGIREQTKQSNPKPGPNSNLDPRVGSDADSTRPTIRNHNKPPTVIARQPILATPSSSSNNIGQPVRELASRINWQLSSWFESLEQKVNGLFRGLANSFSLSSSSLSSLGNQGRQSTRISTRIMGPAGANTGRQREKTFDGRDHELSKRHASQENLASSFNQYNQQSLSCVELKPAQLARCRSIELLVSYNLNSSFPGTLQAIEDNCRHVSNLLADCWPQHLQYLRNSLASWNETVLSMTDFPLPSLASSSSSFSATNLDSNGSPSPVRQAWPPTCGSASQLPDLVMDRINWMWLNLCMDRKFRLDYVENLKCLSLWTQERAQAVCSNEYKRMQMNLKSPLAYHQPATPDRRGSPTAIVQNQIISMQDSGQDSHRRQPRGIDFVPSISIPTVAAAVAANQQQVSVRSLDGLDDREIESKILCCIFDLFLRCVNRQAVRDCGRHGGQFVVNFMSRIGTDDMKYLCNSEPRFMASSAPSSSSASMSANLDNIHQSLGQQHQIIAGGGQTNRANQRSGPKRNNPSADRSPFIQRNYCTDARIIAVLYGKSADIYDDRGGISQAAGSILRSTAHRDHFGDRHNQPGSNYDQNFFEGDKLADSSGSAMIAVSPLLIALLAWIMSCIMV